MSTKEDKGTSRTVNLYTSHFTNAEMHIKDDETISIEITKEFFPVDFPLYMWPTLEEGQLRYELKQLVDKIKSKIVLNGYISYHC
jgi:hypothetical protein